jgi:hypothetical protein
MNQELQTASVATKLLRVLWTEYEDRKAQWGSEYLWSKHEDAEAIAEVQAFIAQTQNHEPNRQAEEWVAGE